MGSQFNGLLEGSEKLGSWDLVKEMVTGGMPLRGTFCPQALPLPLSLCFLAAMS
jgi:hypothetical protein